MSDLTEDQQWCLDRAQQAKDLAAPIVSSLFAEAAEHPDTATIARQVFHGMAVDKAMKQKGGKA